MAWRTLEPFADYIRLRDLPSARFRLNVRHQWLGQSYGETLHEVIVLHLRHVCKTSEDKEGKGKARRRPERKLSSEIPTDWSIECQSDLSRTIRPQVTELAYIQQMRDNHRIGLDLAVRPKTPGFNAVGIFLFFGAIMASLAATTLLWRGTALDRIWDLNAIAYTRLAPLGYPVEILFLLLGAALTTAGIGWFRRRLWGWRLVVVIIATQVLGDVVNCIRGDLLRGGTGVIIASALLLFLLQPRVRATFA
jgi:hypothetical protein